MKNLTLNQKFLFSQKQRENNAPLQSKFDKFANIFVKDNFDSFKANLPEFYKVLKDKQTQKEIIKFAKNAKKKWSKFVICGIGGSALGAKAIRDALGLKEYLQILDTIDPDSVNKIAKADLSSTLFLFISKSGSTLETVSQFYFFREVIKNKGLNWKNHSLFITGSKGLFRETATKEDIPVFDIPKKLGGRFSVFSSVGLLPIALAGIDINKILNGAQYGYDKSLSKDITLNIPLRLATAEYLFKKPISVSFIFAKKLMSIGNFWRQLLAESIGKNRDTGILPHVALGTRDQHSDLQLFTEGPDDKLFTFIYEEDENKIKLPKINNKEFSYLSNKTFSKINKSCLMGTINSLIEKNIPVQTLKIERVSEESIGEILFTFEAEIFFLAKMLKVNAFNQPGVEKGKQIAKQILSK